MSSGWNAGVEATERVQVTGARQALRWVLRAY
jgi:hypothetical protein